MWLMIMWLVTHGVSDPLLIAFSLAYEPRVPFFPHNILFQFCRPALRDLSSNSKLHAHPPPRSSLSPNLHLTNRQHEGTFDLFYHQDRSIRPDRLFFSDSLDRPATTICPP